MPDVVEGGAEVQVDHACLVASQRLRHEVDRGMRGPLRAIAVRPRLEIRLEERFQQQLESSLDHAVSDGRNRKDAHLRAAVLWNFVPPIPPWAISPGDQFIPELLEALVHPRCLNGPEGDAIASRRPVVGFRQRVGRPERFLFADVDVQAPAAPRRFRLRLDVNLSPQVLQRDGRRCHVVPASHLAKDTHAVGPLRSAGITPRPHYSGPIRHPLVFRHLPGGFPLYGVPCSGAFTPGRGGLLQSLSASLPPCHRCNPAEVLRRVGQVRRGMLPSPPIYGIGLRISLVTRLRARSLPLWPGDSLTTPGMALSIGFRSLISRCPAIHATGRWLLPRWVCPPLNTPALAGRTNRAKQEFRGESLPVRSRCREAARTFHAA
jgi:hypothetical protein